MSCPINLDDHRHPAIQFVMTRTDVIPGLTDVIPGLEGSDAVWCGELKVVNTWTQAITIEHIEILHTPEHLGVCQDDRETGDEDIDKIGFPDNRANFPVDNFIEPGEVYLTKFHFNIPHHEIPKEGLKLRIKVHCTRHGLSEEAVTRVIVRQVGHAGDRH